MQALLSMPNPEDPLDNEIAAVWKGDPAKAHKTAAEWTALYANSA